MFKEKDGEEMEEDVVVKEDEEVLVNFLFKKIKFNRVMRFANLLTKKLTVLQLRESMCKFS